MATASEGWGLPLCPKSMRESEGWGRIIFQKSALLPGIFQKSALLPGLGAAPWGE